MPFEEELTPQLAKDLIRSQDCFTQAFYQDEIAGLSLPYNLFVPPVQAGARLPLVCFLHDLGSIDTDTRRTLRQGIGATVWATQQWQAENPCVVLAPQFCRQIVNDAFETAPEVECALRLLEWVLATQPVDPARVYVTGQSMGCMTALEWGIRRPRLFAGYLLIAGQWDISRMDALADQNLWVIVSQGDLKARPGMDEAFARWRQLGARAQCTVLDPNEGLSVLQAGAEKQRALQANIHYTQLMRRAGVADGGDSHVDTWNIAYRLKAPRQWLFTQHR